MRHWATWRKAIFVASIVASSCVAGSAVAQGEPRRLALVIGNAVYGQMPARDACGSSANTVAAALKRAGFDVTQLGNVTNAQMGAAISGFADTIAKASGSIAVAYVCGYAMAYDGRIFLLPASANLARDADVMTQGLISRQLATRFSDPRRGPDWCCLTTRHRPTAMRHCRWRALSIPQPWVGRALPRLTTVSRCVAAQRHSPRPWSRASPIPRSTRARYCGICVPACPYRRGTPW